MRKNTLAFWMLVSSLALAAPTGWQSFTDKTGKCSFQAPANWKKSFGSFVKSPDKSATAHALVEEDSLATIKQVVASFKPKILEDSANRLFYRVVVSGTTEYYMAIAHDAQVCIVRANSSKPTAALEETLKQIASSAQFSATK